MEEYSTKFYTVKLCPKVQPLTLLYNIFKRKETPFVYLLQSKWFPFHIPYQVMMMMKMMIWFETL